jgi:hypothetical protein
MVNWFKTLRSYFKNVKLKTRSLKLLNQKPVIIRKFKTRSKKNKRIWTVIYRFNEKRLTTKKKRKTDVKKELKYILNYHKDYLKKNNFKKFYVILQFYIIYKIEGKAVYSIGGIELNKKDLTKTFFQGINEYGIKILKLGKRRWKDWIEYPEFISNSNRRLYFIALKTFEIKKVVKK